MIIKHRMQASSSVLAGDFAMSDLNGEARVPVPQRTYQVVVAATHKMGIGKDGKLPWRLPSDLKFFKELTISTSNPGKRNAVVMGRKTWESIPLNYRPLPGRLNVVLTRSGNGDIATVENVIMCRSMPSALKLLAESPYCSSIEKVFVIGGGQVLRCVIRCFFSDVETIFVDYNDVSDLIHREALNAPGCDAIHITKIEASIECDTFIPTIDTSVFHPWYSSIPILENNTLYYFMTYVRVRGTASESLGLRHGVKFEGGSGLNKLEIQGFTFLPKMIFERHEEFIYLRLVQEIITSGTHGADRIGIGTISKFGCQVISNF